MRGHAWSQHPMAGMRRQICALNRDANSPILKSIGRPRWSVALLSATVIAIAGCTSSPPPQKRPTFSVPPASTSPTAGNVAKSPTTSQPQSASTAGNAVTRTTLAVPAVNAATKSGASGTTSSTAVQSLPLPPPGTAGSTKVSLPVAKTAAASALGQTTQSTPKPAPAPSAASAASSGAASSGVVATQAASVAAAANAATKAVASENAPPAVTANVNATNPEAPDDVMGDLSTYTAKYEDTLLDIALDNSLGFLELVAANQGVDVWIPGAGTKILLPKARILPTGPRDGIVINIPEQRMYYFRKGQLTATYPIGVFREGFSTPIGSTKIVRKTVDPTWYPTKSSREEHPELPAAVPPGPDNPLGSRAMYLGWARYIIHGTNKPYGVGRRVSHGCIRMQPDDVEALFDMVPVGTTVHTVNQPIKVGWWRGELFVQAHPNLEQGISLEETGKIDPIDVPDIRDKVTAKAGAFADRVDWNAVETALKERRGIPVQVTNRQVPVADAASPTPKPQQPASSSRGVVPALQAQAVPSVEATNRVSTFARP